MECIFLRNKIYNYKGHPMNQKYFLPFLEAFFKLKCDHIYILIQQNEEFDIWLVQNVRKLLNKLVYIIFYRSFDEYYC